MYPSACHFGEGTGNAARGAGLTDLEAGLLHHCNGKALGEAGIATGIPLQESLRVVGDQMGTPLCLRLCGDILKDGPFSKFPYNCLPLTPQNNYFSFGPIRTSKFGRSLPKALPHLLHHPQHHGAPQSCLQLSILCCPTPSCQLSYSMDS